MPERVAIQELTIQRLIDITRDFSEVIGRRRHTTVCKNTRPERVAIQELTTQRLKQITRDFSEVIGRSRHTTVYKGWAENGEVVAVHMMHDSLDPYEDDKIFLNQLRHLDTLRHRNIVRVVGYCHHTRCELMPHTGRLLVVEKVCRAICFEYLHYGSLRDYLADELNGLDWCLRYKIIKGACEGLKYLHHAHEEPLCHLNIYPDSILLDVNMEPKLSDFYMSRFIHNKEIVESWTRPSFRTMEHVPPEYIDQDKVSEKFDIFSLGILMVNIIAGPEGRSRSAEMSHQDFIDQVLRNWRSRLELAFPGNIVDAYCQQVEICTTIALNCMEADRHGRPEVVDIIEMLQKTEIMTGMIKNDIDSSMDKVVRVTREYTNKEGVEELSGKNTINIESQNYEMGPKPLAFQHLKEITDNFSDSREFSQNGERRFYKGVCDNGENITVMVPYIQDDWRGEKFVEEIGYLMKLEHRNIVKLVGYAFEISKVLFKLDEQRTVLVENHKRAICMDYFSKGSLELYLTDELSGLDWKTRYKIIKGTCEGLKYLHDGFEPHIFHLAMSPDTIWLDSIMEPKISDFSMSMSSDQEEIRPDPELHLGIRGYTPPEYTQNGIVSRKFDIFSLGIVLLKIVAGPSGPQMSSDMPRQQFIKSVCGNWKRRLQVTYRGATIDAYCQQVETLIEMAMNCMEFDRHKRPDIVDITLILNTTEAHQGFYNPEVWKMSFQTLEAITNKFSKEIGKGAFGYVYKGKLPNGEEVAVKRLNQDYYGNQTKQIESEEHLKNLEHRNIVRLIGYCHETVQKPVRSANKPEEYIFRDVTESLLCYELLSGNLEDNIWPKGKSPKPDWQTRYSVIQGICEGLHYLHRGCQNAPIVHRDLKPGNILLDDKMVPKLGDFGLSRIVPKTQAHITAVVGSSGYMAPESLANREITPMSDIYSLGVVILEIVTGDKCPYSEDHSGRHYIEKVRKARKQNSYVASSYQSLEDCFLLQAQSWISIGLRCAEKQPEKRPTIEQIMHFIETESANSMDKEAGGKVRIMSFKELQDMTNNFSVEELHGKYIFCDIYKGERVDGELMAVLKLKDKGLSLVNFTSQVNHFRFEHRNILQLKGYCNETMDVTSMYEDKYIDEKVRVQQLLCYEFLQNGTLDNLIFGEESHVELDWEARYKIIKDICQTLKYLHEDCENAPQLHMALTPSNIWLDDKMVPKLGACGLSKLFTSGETQLYNAGIPVSREYAAPELVDPNRMSTKSDIYSLGVLIIEIVTGHNYASSDVFKSWMKDSYIISKYQSLDASGLQQVKGCIKVGMHCVDYSPDKRPAAGEIISMLEKECTVGRFGSLPFWRCTCMGGEKDVNNRS